MMDAFDERKTKIRLTLRAGQRGTKRLMAQYGDRLVCVRYRYDAARQKRIKTVELVVDETDWTPAPTIPADDALVGVRIAVTERQLQRAIKTAGGKWNAEKMVWELPYRRVVTLELQHRMCSS